MLYFSFVRDFFSCLQLSLRNRVSPRTRATVVLLYVSRPRDYLINISRDVTQVTTCPLCSALRHRLTLKSESLASHSSLSSAAIHPLSLGLFSRLAAPRGRFARDLRQCPKKRAPPIVLILVCARLSFVTRKNPAILRVKCQSLILSLFSSPVSTLGGEAR